MNFNISHYVIDIPEDRVILISSELQEWHEDEMIKLGVKTLLSKVELEAVWIGRNALIDQIKMKHEKELSEKFANYCGK